MTRVVMFVLAGGLAALVGGMVYLGAFPPTPASHSVERTLSTADFHPR